VLDRAKEVRFVGGDGVDKRLEFTGGVPRRKQLIIIIERIEPAVAEPSSDAIAQQRDLAVHCPNTGLPVDELLELRELFGC